MQDMQAFRFKRQIAAHIGITRNWLSNILSGAPCSDEIAAKLAGIVGVKPKLFHGPADARKDAVDKFIERSRIEYLRRKK